MTPQHNTIRSVISPRSLRHTATKVTLDGGLGTLTMDKLIGQT